MGKRRTPIPEVVSANVLYLHHMTCCICADPGRNFQIHHLDSNPTNHTVENLAVLCLHCHDKTQSRGGFSKKLTPSVVRHYRDEWIKRVAERRSSARRIVSENSIPETVYTHEKSGEDWQQPSSLALISYVEALPEILKSAYTKARTYWDTGITAEMREGHYAVIDIIEQMVIQLSRWFPPDHFDNKPSEVYFFEYISSRFQYWRALYEKNRKDGRVGTIVGVQVGSRVNSDAKQMIVDMVGSPFLEDLMMDQNELDFNEWRIRWNQAQKRPAEETEMIIAELRKKADNCSIEREAFVEAIEEVVELMRLQ